MKKALPFLIIMGLMLLSVVVVPAKDNKVLANGKETFAKEGDGKSIGAFPDISKTPPTDGLDPLPYPNQASSEDTKKDSKTPKLKGKDVKVENRGSISRIEEEEASTEVDKKLKRKQQSTKQKPPVKSSSQTGLKN